MGRRVVEVKTQVIHASSLEKLGHYDYVEETVCGRFADLPLFVRAVPDAVVTCLFCAACLLNEHSS